MDRRFLEFWGHALLQAAGSRKQQEELFRWMRQGFKGVEELTSLFRNAYGLDNLPKSSPNYEEAWKSATADFRRAFTETFGRLGWVPQEAYESLEAENRRLKKALSEQEQHVRRLRSLLDQKGLDQGKTLEVLQDLVRKQGDAFSRLMNRLSTDTGDPKP
jgi:hypothetical protein